MEDIDAASAAPFTHWLIWNIDPRTVRVEEKSVPYGGIEGMNDLGKKGYSGPCPPSGMHRYMFKLFALDTKLSLGVRAVRGDVERAMEHHILTSAEHAGVYSRRWGRERTH